MRSYKVTVDMVYGEEKPDIPVGYKIKSFRPVRVGDVWLAQYGGGATFADSYEIPWGPFLILTSSGDGVAG